MKRIALLLPLLMTLWGCEVPEMPVPEMHEAKESEKVLPKDEVVSQLPCFKCHSYEKFKREPAPGVFSHTLHSAVDVHCNGCHEISGHMPVAVKSDICASCHSLKSVTYAGGGMGKVVFNHSAHSKSFACGSCHPGLFQMKKGAVSMKMDDMYQGKLCGACHDGKKAFSSQECTLCHKG